MSADRRADGESLLLDVCRLGAGPWHEHLWGAVPFFTSLGNGNKRLLPGVAMGRPGRGKAAFEYTAGLIKYPPPDAPEQVGTPRPQGQSFPVPFIHAGGRSPGSTTGLLGSYQVLCVVVHCLRL